MMNLEDKLKNARIQADLTQEQAALKLNVSRQTISNWENGKTYPDIISVVKMSDLYQISLDHLLKGNQDETNYLNYLAESTNTIKRKFKLSVLILFTIYLLFFFIALISFWCFSDGSDAMGYSVLFLIIIFPIITFIISVFIGGSQYFKQWKWLFSILFGGLYMLVEYSTFNMANMIANQHFNYPNWKMLFIGAMISLFGLCIGYLLFNFKEKRIKKIKGNY